MRHPNVPMSLLALALLTSTSSADDPKPKSKTAKAPGDSQIFETDLAGAYFIAKPLKEEYDTLQKRVASLKGEVREARIDPARARRLVASYQEELKALMEKIQATKLYIPGASIKTVTVTSTLPIAADDLLLIDAEDVEIRGWDGPGIQCVLEKTVLDEDGTKFDADLAGIELVARQGSGAEFFGYYANISKMPGGQAEWDRSPFQDYVKATFPYVTIKGLTYQEGNRQIDIKLYNEKGNGTESSRWRRHAKLVLNVPKCRKVAVRGGLGTFKVRDLNASLSVLGQGNRDYAATFEVTNLGGSLKAESFPIHRLDGIRGDVAIDGLAYLENRSSGSSGDGQWARSEAPKPSIYRDITGDLTAKFCRADLTLEKLLGRVDIQNDFGNTTWTIDEPIAQKRDHRVVSQSGTIDLRLDPKSLGDLTLSLFTEAGALHQAEGVKSFQGRMFTTADGDEVRRSWHAQIFQKDPNRRPTIEERFAAFRRPADALHGRPGTPGVDILSRAGTITVSPVADDGHRH
jgi:hypothetical protein